MIAERVIERARSVRVEDEIAKRGIRLKGRIDQCGPCPVCGGRDRFAIHVKKQKWLCRHCDVGGGDAISLVQFIDSIGFVEAVELLSGAEARPQAHPSPPAPAKQSAAEYERQQHRKAAWLWSQRQPIIGSIADPYLRETRGYSGPLPPTLGLLPPLRPEYHPALIAAFAVVDEPEPGVLGKPQNVTAIHLTLLKPDGSDKANIKPNKITIGSPGGLPIVIAPANDLLGLAIAEGIEDALTAHQALGLGAWAAGSASFMPALATTVPDYITCVTIFAHSDKAGAKNARKLEAALSRRKSRQGERPIDVIVEGLP
jgi:hypothetical protein